MFNFILGHHRRTENPILLLVSTKPAKTTQLKYLWKIFDTEYYPTHAGQAFVTEAGFMIFTGGSISMNLDVETIDIMKINKIIAAHDFVTIETDYENDHLLLLTNTDTCYLPSQVWVEDNERFTSKELRNYHLTLGNE